MGRFKLFVTGSDMECYWKPLTFRAEEAEGLRSAPEEQQWKRAAEYIQGNVVLKAM